MEKFDKSYVLYANEKYHPIVTKAAQSIRQFSDLPIIVYLLNSDKKVDVENTKTIKWTYNSNYTPSDEQNMYNNSEGNFYINRSNKDIYELLIQRPLITKDALEKYSNTVCYVDTDSIATIYCNRIFDMYDNTLNYPYFAEGIYEYMHYNGRGGAETREDMSTTLEHPACELFNVDQYIRRKYRQTGYYVAGQNTIDFLEEWYHMCVHPKILKNNEYYAAYHEETIVNVLLWKHKILDGLPYMYSNGSLETIKEIYDEIGFNGTVNHIRSFLKVPAKEENLLFFHGEKRTDVMNEMMLELNKRFFNIDRSKNWGDVISNIILEKFSGRKIPKNNVMHFDKLRIVPFKDGKILAVGSSMLFTRPNDYVWGTGCISKGQVGKKPKKVYAVRGQLTRDELLKKGIVCPEVYGDPALLFPMIYDPKVEVKYEYGIIPHYIDYTDPNVVILLKNLEKKGIKIINITSGVNEFIDEIKEVKKVMSSSLHGLIAADAYGIPNARVTLTNKIVGGDFKFEDYRLSVKKKESGSLKMDLNNFEEVMNNLKFELGDISIRENLLKNSPMNDSDFPYFKDEIQPREEIKTEQTPTKDKIKLLFLAPHLSTGGMPSFLLKRIELLQKYSDEIDLHVVEYSLYSDIFVVQREKIKSLLPENRFWSLGWFGDNKEQKSKLIDIIKDNNIDIVHIEEIPEGFDSFNKIPKKLLSELYSNNRTWRLVETCHNIWFDPKTSKRYDPDGYAFCTPYHSEVTFSQEKPHSKVIEFPIENNFRSNEDKVASQVKLGLDTNKIHVVNVGLWTPGKNQKEGVEIARLLEHSNPEIQFHFIGNLASNFQDYWSPITSNLPSNVKVWGERDDVDDFMKASDIFMFNSTWECNPIVLREAISYGLKILSRNLPQYLDMFTPYVVALCDNEELNKEKLLQLIKTNHSYDLLPGQSLEFVNKHISFYKEVMSNSITTNDLNKSKINITQHYVGQPFLEITGESDDTYKIEVYDENNKLYYSNELPSNRWIKLNRTYFTKWNTKIWEGDNLIYDNSLNYENKRVFIAFDSGSLGDSIAWIPYCLEFKKKHNCHVVVSTFWNKLFKKSYPELEFVDPNTVVDNLHGMYQLGWFYNPNKEPVLPNIIPLQKATTNILGLDFTEIKPNLDFIPKANPYNKKYITIATNSTAGCKFWTRDGWQNLINYLHNKGYKIINVSKENNPFKNVEKIRDTSIENTMNVIHHSEFFIGLSSGLSWLSWALGKHVVMISNFTEPDHEFTSNCTRIINKSVCNGCWNNPDFKFDKSDWNWCPIHKGTSRQFECHTSITSEMVIDQINHLLV